MKKRIQALKYIEILSFIIFGSWAFFFFATSGNTSYIRVNGTADFLIILLEVCQDKIGMFWTVYTVIAIIFLSIFFIAIFFSLLTHLGHLIIKIKYRKGVTTDTKIMGEAKAKKFRRKLPSVFVFIRYLFTIIYFLACFYIGGYYLNDIITPKNYWLLYLLYVLIGSVGGILINIVFNFVRPIKTNIIVEIILCILPLGLSGIIYPYLNILGINHIFYFVSLGLEFVILFVNAMNISTKLSPRCPYCHGKCDDGILIKVEEKDLGTSTHSEERSRKIGTRETTYTLSDSNGNKLGEGTSSEDIYEDYTSYYDVQTTEYIFTYSCKCSQCKVRHNETEIDIKSSRV